MTPVEALAEVEKARVALRYGADDAAWRPGETAVDALIRRAAEAEARVVALLGAFREIVEADDMIKRNTTASGAVPDFADMNWDLAVERLRDVLAKEGDL